VTISERHILGIYSIRMYLIIRLIESLNNNRMNEVPRFQQFTVHGSRFTVHGSRFTVHGSRFTVKNYVRSCILLRVCRSPDQSGSTVDCKFFHFFYLTSPGYSRWTRRC